MKALNKIKIKWSQNFAYAIGLLATDGNLSKDGRHFNFTSKDEELAELFKSCLGIKNSTCMKASGSVKEKKYYFVQCGDVVFYKFLLGIGLTPRKSKTMKDVLIPDKYFFDFLRGHLDGDGTFYSYWDPRWRSSFMFYTEFISASKNHIDWLRAKIQQVVGIRGHINKSSNKACYQLKYAKAESMLLLKKVYYSSKVPFLKRKHLKINQALAIIGKRI